MKSRPLINLAFLLFPLFAFAATPAIYKNAAPAWIVHPSEVSFRPPSREVTQGYFIVQTEDQVHVEKHARYRRMIRQIVSEAGVQNGSEITVNFDPAFEKLSFHKVIVWRDGKPIDRLQLSDFRIIADEQELSRFVYQGNYSAYLTLKDIRKGDKIEYSYTIEGSNPVFDGKYAGSLYLGEYRPVMHKFTRLIASQGRRLQMRFFNNAARPKVSANGDLQYYEWESFKLKAIGYDDNEPEWFYPCPYVQVTEYKDWAEVIQWAEKVNPASANLRGELLQRVAALKRTHRDKEVLFREAVRFVQDEVRYMGIEMGAYSHRANTPEKVYAQRYGDCKDKALLLVSVLRSLGIEAYLALVNTTDRQRTGQYLPSPLVFDHVVVKARVSGSPVWVDATISYQGGKGTAICFPDYGKALVIDKKSDQLTDIPAGDPGKIVSEELYTISNRKSPVRLKVSTVYSQYEADKMRRSLASGSVDKREKDYLNYYAQTYPDIKAADTLVIHDDPEKNELTLIEMYTIRDFFKRDSVLGNFNATFDADCIRHELADVSPGRKNPLSVSWPLNLDFTVKVLLPGGWNIETESREIRRDSYYYKSDYFAGDDLLTLHYQFRFLKDHIAPAKFAEYTSDIKRMKEDYLAYTIVYTPDEVPFYPNYPMIVAGMVLCVMFAAVAWYISHRETGMSWHMKVPLSLGGWLILVILALLVTMYFSVKNVVEKEYFDLNHWEAYSSMSSSFLYKSIQIAGAFTDIYIACFAVFCLVLLLKRRDILPRIIIFYFASSSVLTTFVYVLSSRLYRNEPLPDTVVYSIIGALIYIAYFKNSPRVKATFVVPYIKKEK